MLNITVTITAAPELLNTINNLFGVLGSFNQKTINTESKEKAQSNSSVAVQPAQYMPVKSAYAPAPTAAVPAYTQPTAVPTQAPVQTPAPVANPAAVPTASQTYSMEQLAVAATQIVDAGRRTELVALLASFGVQALTALPKEQYGAFATQLRAMGAKL